MPGGRYPSNYVYVMVRHDRRCKVGRANDVGKRFYQLFYGSGGSINDHPLKHHHPVRVAYSVGVKATLAQRIESLALRILRAEYGGAGEDFDCSEEIAIDAVRLAHKIVMAREAEVHIKEGSSNG